jgi:hypothetical protein
MRSRRRPPMCPVLGSRSIGWFEGGVAYQEKRNPAPNVTSALDGLYAAHDLFTLGGPTIPGRSRNVTFAAGCFSSPERED